MNYIIVRFLKVYDEIKKAFIDLKLCLPIFDYRKKNWGKFKSILEILYVGVKKICDGNENIITGNKIVYFILFKLLKTDRFIGENIYNNINTKNNARKNNELIEIFKYIRKLQEFNTKNTDKQNKV